MRVIATTCSEWETASERHHQGIAGGTVNRMATQFKDWGVCRVEQLLLMVSWVVSTVGLFGKDRMRQRVWALSVTHG
eukprot:scaffold138381_cov36-Tisochrysis_lutea.AAC.1